MTDDPPLAECGFAARLIEWRGPAPYVFAPLPPEVIGEVAHAARSASYGWGCVPVRAMIGATRFGTSLIPRHGGYLLPVRQAVQRAEGIGPGSSVDIRLRIG